MQTTTQAVATSAAANPPQPGKPTHFHEMLRWAAEDLSDPAIRADAQRLAQKHSVVLKRLAPYLEDVVQLAWRQLQGDQKPSPQADKRQTSIDSRLNGGGVTVKHTAQLIALTGVLAGLLVSLPGCSEPLTPPTGQALLDTIQNDKAGARPVGTGRNEFGQQEGLDWISRTVELLSNVPPECRAVAHQEPNKKCEGREQGVLEQFKHEHPVTLNLMVAGLTLLAGFQIGGGFQGGKRK